MRMITTLTLAALLAVPALAAEDRRCLRASQIDGFKDAERGAVTLTENGNDFRVEFVGSCLGLEDALGVAAKSATACFEAGDSISFRDQSGFPRTCVAGKVTFIPKDKKSD